MFFLSNQQSKSGAGTRQDQASSFLRSEVLTEPIEKAIEKGKQRKNIN